MSRLVITGVTGSGSPNRLEINDLVQDEKFFSLYIQALRKFSPPRIVTEILADLNSRGYVCGDVSR